MKRPRIGIVQGGAGSFGGQPLAAARMGRLLGDRVEPVMLWLEDGSPGGATEHAQDGNRGWRLRCPLNSRSSTTEAQTAWHADQVTRVARLEGLAALHLHGAFDWPLAALGAAAALDLPLVVSFRGSDVNMGVFSQPAVLEALLEGAEVCTFMNPVQERLARRMFRLRGTALCVPNHVDPSRFVAEPVTLSVPGPRLGCVAEFRRVTGLDLLLEAFARLQARRPLSLVLVGPFSRFEAPYYTRFLDNLPGRERVLRTGAVPHGQVLGYMAACDLMVFPSIAEGMANKVLEAMLAGTPVVASRVPGNRELVEDGVDGRLFEPRDARDLERVLDEALDDPARAAWARRAREKVLREYTPSREREGWLECYRAAGVLP